MNDTDMSAESSVTNDNDDPVAVTILTLLTELEPGKTLTPESAARSFGKDATAGRTRPTCGDAISMWYASGQSTLRVPAGSRSCAKANPSTRTISRASIGCD